MLGGYLLFIMIIVILLGIVYYVNSVEAIERNAYNNLNVLADKMSQQLDNLIRHMDFISLSLLSDEEFLFSMKTLVALNRDKAENQRLINEAYDGINSALFNYMLSRDFYSVNVFNSLGDFFSSDVNRTKGKSIQYNREIIKNIQWTRLADENKGRIIVIPPYFDPWTDDARIRVFSVVRVPRGMEFDVGYIEVQESYDTLKELFYVEEDLHISVMVLTRENEILYSSGIEDPFLIDFYCNLVKRGECEPYSISIPGLSYDQIITVTASDYTGIRILLAQNKQVLIRHLSIVKWTILLATSGIIALSFIYVYIFSRYLTKPLRKLIKEIEHTDFKNLADDINLPKSFNDEIKSLNIAFINLRERLKDSIDREIRAKNLYLQACFESLQARVNPHFIYNILNVISNRGIMCGDTVISDICQSVAAMLRYSTSTERSSATIAEELEHVKNYLNIMGKRFEHRLEYDIDVEPELLTIKMPKIVLQPLVENSINHGFVNVDRVMKINIRGFKSGKRWVIKVEDNGQGFERDKLKDLNMKMKAIHNSNMNSNMISENTVGIGGMGLINLYSRLLLYFKNSDFKFVLCNKPEGGACVVLSAYLNPEEVSKDEIESDHSG